MTEIERIIAENIEENQLTQPKLAKALEKYFRNKLLTSQEQWHKGFKEELEQKVLKARIEFYERYRNKMMNSKYCDEQIAQLNKELGEE